MNDQQIISLFMVCAGVIVLVCLSFMWHADRDADLGRELRRAAGGESGARMAIESANLDRLLERKFDGEIRKAQRPSGHRLPRNVVRLVPKITSGGRAVNFPPDGAA